MVENYDKISQDKKDLVKRNDSIIKIGLKIDGAAVQKEQKLKAMGEELKRVKEELQEEKEELQEVKE